MMACRLDPLRVGRSLHDLYIPSAGAPVGRDQNSSCRPTGGPRRSRCTSHEVTPRRAHSSSGKCRYTLEDAKDDDGLVIEVLGTGLEAVDGFEGCIDDGGGGGIGLGF